MRPRSLYLSLFVMPLLLAVACGPAEPTDPMARAVAQGKADLPDWVRDTGASLSCTTPASSHFVGYDSAHLYHLPVVKGMGYTLDLGGSYDPLRGAGLSVFDGLTGQTVAEKTASWNNQLQLSFVATHDGEALVAAYTIQWWANGAYTLDVSCAVSNLPDCSPTPPAYPCGQVCSGGYYVGSWGVTCGCCAP